MTTGRQTDPESVPGPRLQDDRGPSFGLGRLVMAAFWVVGLGLTVLAGYELLAAPSFPLGTALITLFAGALYIGAAVGLTHNGKKMRRLAWSCITVALAGPVIIGLSEFGATGIESVWSPWGDFGLRTGFAVLWLPIVGYVWLWWSNPSRIVQLAEGVERQKGLPKNPR